MSTPLDTNVWQQTGITSNAEVSSMCAMLSVRVVAKAHPASGFYDGAAYELNFNHLQYLYGSNLIFKITYVDPYNQGQAPYVNIEISPVAKNQFAAML